MKLALFDLDNTLLPIDSDYSWVEFVKKLGWLEDEALQAQNEHFYQQYLNQSLDIHAYIAYISAILQTQKVAHTLKARDQFMQEIIFPAITPQALQLVAKYQNNGYECILITATNDFVTLPIAAALGFKHLISTNLAYDGHGLLTGEIAGTPSFREGKVTRLEQWLSRKGKNWEDVKESVFFSDSINDLPLLEKVHTPVATNPDDQLKKIAMQRNWEILELFKNHEEGVN